MANNISASKMYGYLDRIVGEQKPITADIFLTNYCNNKCPYCTYARWELEKGARHMSLEEFEKYADVLVSNGVKGMILTGGGEPTVNPDFLDITKYLEDKGIPYGINTNFNKLVYIKPAYLKVSLDGYDEDSYEESRGVRAYEKVRDNIITYSKWKEVHSPNTSLGIQVVATSPEQIVRFYRANRDLPVDYISVRPIESTSGEYYKAPDNRVGAMIGTIKSLREVDDRVMLNYKWEMLETRHGDCLASWAQIALNEKGEVMYCCHKPYEIIGHILDEDIFEKKRTHRTNMNTCDVPCRMTAPNEFINMINSPQKNIEFI